MIADNSTAHTSMSAGMWLVAFAVLFFRLPASADEVLVDFDREVRPILSDNCYACHGPDEQARESELRLDTREGAMAELDGHFALVAGNPAASELIRRILSDDEDQMMPPADHRRAIWMTTTIIQYAAPWKKKCDLPPTSPSCWRLRTWSTIRKLKSVKSFWQRLEL